MKLNRSQTDLLSKYLAALSKILFGSVVVGFFIPNAAGAISVWIFIAGSLAATACVFLGIKLTE